MRHGRGSSYRWCRLVVLVLGLFVGVVTGTLFWLTRPEQVGAQVRRLLDDRLQLRCTFDAARFVAPGRLVIERLTVDSPPGARFPHVLHVPRATIEFSVGQWWREGQPIRRIHLENPRVFVELLDDSSVPLGQILAPVDESSLGRTIAFPDVQIDRLEVHTCPETIFRQDQPLLVETFSLTVDDDRRYHVASSAAHPLFRRIDLAGEGARLTGRFHGDLKIGRLTLDSRIRGRLPARFTALYDTYRPEGAASARLGFDVEHGRLTDWALELQILGANIETREPHLALDAVHGTIGLRPEVNGEAVSLRPGRIETIVPLTGRVRGAAATLEGVVSLADLAITDHDVTLEVDALPLDSETIGLFEGELRSILELLDPRGKASVRLGLRGAATPEVELQRMELTGARLLGPRLPVALESLEGALVRVEDRVEVDLRGVASGRPARLRGVVGTDLDRFDLRLDLENLDLEADLQPILPEAAADVWREYAPRGQADFSLEVTKGASDAVVLLVATVSPKDARIEYERFPYAVTDISGSVRLTGHLDPDHEYHFTPLTIDLSTLRGRHDSVSLRVDASQFRFPQDGRPGSLQLEIIAPNLTLSEELVQALPGNASKLLRTVELDGALSTVVRIFHPRPGEPLEFAIDAEVHTPVVVRYQPLAYPLRLRRGTASYRFGSRSLILRGIETVGGADPVVRIDGTHAPGAAPDSHELQLFISIGAGSSTPGLALDDREFVDHLPDRLSRLLDRLEAAGHVVGNLQLLYEYELDAETRRPHDPRVEYQGELNLIDVRAKVGMQVQEIFSEVLIHGTAGASLTPKHRFNAYLPRGQLRVSRFLLRDADVQVSFGEQHLRLDYDTDDYEIPAPFRPRLASRQTHEALQVYLKSGNVYGGHARGFFFVDAGIRRDYLGHFLADGVDLSIASPDLVRQGESLGGSLKGEVQFSGATDQKDSLDGKGYFRVRDGKIKRLPVAISVLTNPLLGWLDSWDDQVRTVREVDARFDLRGRDLLFPTYDDLVLRTPKVEIRGRGRVGFDKSIDLLLEPRGSLYGLIGLGDLLDGLVRQRLTGTLQQPIRSSAPLE